MSVIVDGTLFKPSISQTISNAPSLVSSQVQEPEFQPKQIKTPEKPKQIIVEKPSSQGSPQPTFQDKTPRDKTPRNKTPRKLKKVNIMIYLFKSLGNRRRKTRKKRIATSNIDYY